MKTNNTKKNSATKKLIPAVSMLTVSAMMLSTATYAWFTMNKTVQVTGMQMQTKVSGNLLICQDNVEANYKPDTIQQSRKALLEPVSSTTGATGSFWYTINATADGKKNDGNYTQYSEGTNLADGAIDAIAENGYASSGAAKTAYDVDFNGASGYNISGAANNAAAAYTNAYGYVDYTFYLKATSDTNNQVINMTWCNLLRSADNGTSFAALDSDNNAWRVAVFAEKLADSNTHAGVYATDVATAGNQKSLLGTTGADYFTDDQAVNSATGTGAVVKKGTAVVIDTIETAGTTSYYKVVVRLWLEGEDEDCFSANYSLKESLYKLDLAFELGKGTAVQNITSSTEAFTADANPAV